MILGLRARLARRLVLGDGSLYATHAPELESGGR
jgi:hypothetical protein